MMVAAVLAVAWPAAARADCAAPADDDELAQCLGQDLRLADQRINASYKAAIGTLDEAGKTALRNAQRAWLKARDATCGLDNKETDRERWMQAILRDHKQTVCVVRFTNQRVTELETPAAAPRPAAMAEDVYEVYGPGSRSTGKWYFEVAVDQGAVARTAETALWVGYLGPEVNSGRLLRVRKLDAQRGVVTIGVAIDLQAGKVYTRNDGQWFAAPGSAGGLDVKLARDYRAGVTSSTSLTPLVRGGMVKINFGDQPFVYSLPDGYRPYNQL